MTAQAADKIFLRALKGEPTEHPPIWLMRQAGRYLPEYREVRSNVKSFLDLCYTPELAIEVTLQPIRRYGFDASILFSDILVVPDALGQSVKFVEGEGPRLTPLENAGDLAKLSVDKTAATYARVCETVAGLRAALPAETTLIGFCGAPYTVATYMIGGKGSPDQALTRLAAYRDPEFFNALMDLLVETSTDYLSQQVAAGAEVLQIFDSWAGNLPETEFERWVIAPTSRLVANLKPRIPEVPIIGFPRGVGPLYEEFIHTTGVDAVSCDTSLPLDFIRDSLQKHVPVQGNLDPLLLVSGGQEMTDRVEETLSVFGNRNFIFNLGHGIVPQTPPDHVAQLVAQVKANK